MCATLNIPLDTPDPLREFIAQINGHIEAQAANGNEVTEETIEQEVQRFLSASL